LKIWEAEIEPSTPEEFEKLMEEEEYEDFIQN
jgi:hypothetical protein